MKLKINKHAIFVIALRDLRRYFASPTGYLFIFIFIFLSAAAAFWQERFFADNLANLNQLDSVFPILLLFFIPAVTMNIWSEERRQGTDELLLTLPATDIEIVLGKYVAALGIYTAALILSISHVFVLMWLGSPDLGLMFSNYVGFWLIGAALIAAGMFASLLTSNATIAFILGVVFCGFFVYIGSLDWLTGDWLGRLTERLSVISYFADFSKGILSFSSLLYFISVAAVMLYANTVTIGRRHWPGDIKGRRMVYHYTVRAFALAVAGFALVAIFQQLPIRCDATAEGLYSLSNQTKDLIKNLPDNRRVLVQAYISPEVPRDLVETRADIIGDLEEIAAMGGDKVQVMIHDTEPFTETSREAREKFGIVPHELLEQESARAGISKVFMGLAFTCGANEEVIPFFDRGLPVEYELVRSIRSVAHSERKTVGVISGAVKLFGGYDFQTGKRNPPWEVVDELKKQYNVTMIDPHQPITQDMDVLMVVLPSSLSQPEMDNLKTYILSGKPTLILADPMPVFDIMLSPIIPSDAQVNPYAQQGGQPPEQKGDIASFLSSIGVNWNYSNVVWDAYNPHPDLAAIQQEVVFVGPGNKNPEAFNENDPVSSGLQELVMIYCGNLEPPRQPNLQFTPLLQTGQTSGLHQWGELVQRGIFGLTINPRPRRVPSPLTYTLAAQISGYPGQTRPGDSTNASGQDKVNLLVIADLDFISSQFFKIRESGISGLDFDNVNFFLNCLDQMAGDSSYIGLRKKRVKHRTLTAVENRTGDYIQRRLEDEKKAEDDAQQALREAQQHLNDKVAEVRDRTDLDDRTKQIMAQNLQEVENRKFEVTKANIEANKDAAIARGQEDMEMAVRGIQSRIKMVAVLLPPIPVFVMGVFIFIKRRKREREGAMAARRMRR